MSQDLSQQARSLFAQSQFAAAEPLFRQLARNDPANAEAAYNLGVALGKLDRLEEALDCYKNAIRLAPHFSDAYVNFGSCLTELNLVTQAHEAFALARRADPFSPVPVLNEGIAALTLGNYPAGWEGYKARWRLPAYAKFRRDFDKPQWQGEDISGRTLFIYAEQGFGDAMQMARFISVIAARGARVIVEAPPALTRLFRNMPNAPAIIAKGETVPPFDCYCALMDVPGALGVTLETLGSTPYLFADAEATAAYRQALPATARRRVGLVWAGRPTHQNDHRRSLRLADLEPVLQHADTDCVSLQRVVPDRDADFLAQNGIVDWGRGFVDFAAAAAAIMALDLIITVDTAMAHLAGALGKPVWILLPYAADWRWLTQRADSPWYPNARLFRQTRRGKWDDIIAELPKNLGQ